MHCRFVQMFDKDLKRLIYLRYWRTKRRKYLILKPITFMLIEQYCVISVRFLDFHQKKY